MRPASTRIVAATILSSFTLAGVLGSAPLAARADDEDPGVARIALTSGDVDVKRADSGDTLSAAINAPVNVGDYLETRDGGRAELQLDNRTVLRVGENAQLRFTNMTPSFNALQLAQGTVELRLFNGIAAHPEIDTPNATLRPDDNGRYRVTVDGGGNTFVTARSGNVDVVTQSATQTLDAGSTLEIAGDGARATAQTVALVPRDAFERWNDERDRDENDAQSYAYTDPGIVGASDLDRYGTWSDVAGYGEAWHPSYAAGWAPYHDGRWVWEPYYGWTWVSAEPWGWAPYHYGRWFYANQGWYWYPAVVAYQPPVYRPALVAFFSFGIGGAGLSSGFGNVGWVPLAPYEAFQPWWGGSRYYDRTLANVTNVTNVTNNVTVNHYRNIHVPGGAVAVENGNFARGNFKTVIAVSPEQLRSATPVQGVVPIVPTHQNLAFAHAAAPIAARSVAPAFDRFAAKRTAANVEPLKVQLFSEVQASVKTLAQRQYPEHSATFENAPTQTAPGAHVSTQTAPGAVRGFDHAAATSPGSTTSPVQRIKTTSADQHSAAAPVLPQNPAAKVPQQDAAPPTARNATVQRDRQPTTTPPVSTGAPNDAWKRFDHANPSHPPSTPGPAVQHANASAVRSQTYGTGASTNAKNTTSSRASIPEVHQPPQTYHPVEYRRAPAPPDRSGTVTQSEAVQASHRTSHAPANGSEKPPAVPKQLDERPQPHEQLH